MTRDELLEILRAHKISPTRTQYRQNGKAVECVSGCKLAVPYGQSVVVAIEEHQADMLAEAIDIEEYDNYLARRALTQLPGLIP